MLSRRSLFSALSSLPFLGFLKPAQATATVYTSRLEAVAAPLRKTAKLRTWKLGSLEHRVLPTEEAINRLADLLSKWGGKSTLDLVWGPEISVEQFDLETGDIDVVNQEDGRLVFVPHAEKNTEEPRAVSFRD